MSSFDRLIQNLFQSTDENPDCSCEILNKKANIFQDIMYMFDRTNHMFRYTDLPETIPEYMLEYMLQGYGGVVIAEHNSDLYAFYGCIGGPLDVYYRGTQAVIANPALGLTGTFRIVNHFPPFNKDAWKKYPQAVYARNDARSIGLLPLFSRYATQMAENIVSIRSAQINLRQQTIIVADTGPEIESANAYIEGLIAGEIKSIQRRPMLEGIQVENAQTSQSNAIMQLIELQQYLKASWYNDLGLNSNFNMKREYLSTDELQSSSDIMLPMVDDMFISRKQWVDDVNRYFGTSIKVEKDSAWEKKQLASDLGIDIMKQDTVVPEPEPEPEPDPQPSPGDS